MYLYYTPTKRKLKIREPNPWKDRWRSAITVGHRENGTRVQRYFYGSNPEEVKQKVTKFISNHRVMPDGEPIFDYFYTYAEIPHRFKAAYTRTKRHARTRGLTFKLSREKFVELFNHSRGRCAVSGVQFNLDKYENSKITPFAPSVDRKDSSLGYSADNCHLVCIIVNYAQSNWGAAPLLKLVEYMSSQQ